MSSVLPTAFSSRKQGSALGGIIRLMWASMMVAGGLCMAEMALADVVRVTSDTGGKSRELVGTLEDYTGRHLVLTSERGSQRKIPRERVLEVQTNWTAEQLAGNTAFEKQQWSTAANHYLAANQAESRTWVRRLIITRLLQCYQSLNKQAEAGDLFLLLVKSDPTTPAYRYMPLAWMPTSRVDRKQADQWMRQKDSPAAILLGCSHLMATSARAEAVQALATLRRQPTKDHPEIAALAEAQAWRAELITATRADVDRWSQRVATFPEALRAGPSFVVARAYQQLKLPDQAILHYLRIPVLDSDQRQLAAVALTAAARLSQAAGQQGEARTLLGEVLKSYADTSEQPLAQQMLEQLEMTNVQ